MKQLFYIIKTVILHLQGPHQFFVREDHTTVVSVEIHHPLTESMVQDDIVSSPRMSPDLELHRQCDIYTVLHQQA
jgi:hypothetical protein